VGKERGGLFSKKKGGIDKRPEEESRRKRRALCIALERERTKIHSKTAGGGVGWRGEPGRSGLANKQTTRRTSVEKR